jgi:hypothetical protein
MKSEIIMKVFWGVTPCSLTDMYECFEGAFMFRVKPDDGGSMFIRNVYICVSDYTVSHPVFCRAKVLESFK